MCVLIRGLLNRDKTAGDGFYNRVIAQAEGNAYDEPGTGGKASRCRAVKSILLCKTAANRYRLPSDELSSCKTTGGVHNDQQRNPP